jgi:hypothetical protein
MCQAKNPEPSLSRDPAQFISLPRPRKFWGLVRQKW